MVSIQLMVGGNHLAHISLSKCLSLPQYKSCHSYRFFSQTLLLGN